MTHQQLLYHIGDKVIVRSDLRAEAWYYMCDGSRGDGVDPQMLDLCGKVCTIAGITSGNEYLLAEDDVGFWWTDGMFEGKALKLDDIKIQGDCACLFD